MATVKQIENKIRLNRQKNTKLTKELSSVKSTGKKLAIDLTKGKSSEKSAMAKKKKPAPKKKR